jgi:predicted alpha-1,6-mannanase (GH76 family)
VTGKSFTVPSECNGKSMAGGVFWRPTPDDTSVNSITTGYEALRSGLIHALTDPPRRLYLTLSAFLANTTTANAEFEKAAIASANWVRTQNLNDEGLALDGINGHDCSRPNEWMFTYNQGKVIEGLAVLADVTRDQQWSDW